MVEVKHSGSSYLPSRSTEKLNSQLSRSKKHLNMSSCNPPPKDDILGFGQYLQGHFTDQNLEGEVF